MGIFNASSPFDLCVERTTSEKNTSDDWSQIMDVCDKVKESPTGAKGCLKSISKRLANDNPRVVLQTITLLDACINNCGRKFLLEVAGREFEQELSKLITSSKTHPKVSQRLKESLKKWAEDEFKRDPELSLIPALYNKLLKEGYEFEFTTDSPKKTIKFSNDPNVVHSAEEEEDIAKAIQLSLQDSGSNSLKSGNQGSTATRSAGGLYSSASAVLEDTATASKVQEKESLKVRALYDFEAAEDNELTFKAGEIIIVLDNSDSNWWKGTNHRGEGLFPSNFVTTNLEGEAAYVPETASAKKVSFSECVEVTEVEVPPDNTEEATGEIDEDKIDQLLHLLHEADPTGERSDDPSLRVLEDQVNAMAPSIDAELECIDRKHAQLARISTDLVDALNLYHQLMREMPSPMPYYSPYSKMMPNSAPGPQNMIPPHYFPPNSQNISPQQAYPAGQYPPHPPFVGGPGMPPQYMPPHMGVTPQGSSVPGQHMGSPNHHPGTMQFPPSNFHPIPNHGGVGSIPNFNPYNMGAPPEYSAVMPNEGAQNNMASPPAPVTSRPSTAMPPQAFPSIPPPQGHPMNMPPLTAQGPIPSQGPPPMMSLPNQGGPNNRVQPPLSSMTHQGPLPTTGLPHQAPPTNIPSQGPHDSMPPQGHPSHVSYFAQPQMQSMQQPLL